MVQFSHLYLTTGKTRALTRWTFVSKVMSLLFNMISRFVISIEFRAKIQPGDPNVDVVSIWMILKAKRSNEIILKVDKKIKEEP